MQPLTYSSGGQTYIATPTNSTTPAQYAAATGAGWTPSSGGGGSAPVNNSTGSVGSAIKGTPTGPFVTVGGLNYAYNLPSTTQSNAQNVNPTQPMKAPTTSPTYGNTTSASAFTAGTQTYYDTTQKALTDYYAQEKANRDATNAAPAGRAQQGFFDKLMAAPSTSDVRTTASNQIGFNPAMYFADQRAALEEVKNLQTTYNNLVAKKDAAVANSQGRDASNGFINNQVAQIERNAAPELNRVSAQINSKTAIMAAERGLFQEAQSFVNQAVDDATSDLRYNLQLHEALKSDNEDTIKRLDAPYQKALDLKIDALKTDYDRTYAEKKEVGQLLVANPQAGIQISDTLEQAYAKIDKSPQTTATTVGSADTGYFNVIRDKAGNVVRMTPITAGTTATGGYHFTSSQSNDGASKAGLPVGDFKALNGDVQNYFINSSASQIKEMNTMFDQVKSGDLESADAFSAINDSNTPQSVKDFLKEKVNSYAKLASPKVEFTTKVWNFIKDTFSRK